MKKLLIGIFVLFGFLIAACAQTSQTSTTGGLPPDSITETKTAGEKAVESECTFDEAATSAKAIVGKDLAAYPPFVKDVSVGSCATFGIVLGNYHSNLPQAVYAELSYARAYDASNNNPGADEDYMPSWIQTNFPYSVSIEPNDFAVFPVHVIVGEMMSPTLDTKPATYEFELITYTYKGNFKQEYQPPIKLTVKTK